MVSTRQHFDCAVRVFPYRQQERVSGVQVTMAGTAVFTAAVHGLVLSDFREPEYIKKRLFAPAND